MVDCFTRLTCYFFAWCRDMNAWGFWAAVVQSIASAAWPVAFISAVWILRKDIRRLLPYAQLKFAGNEISFRRIQEVIDQARLSEVTNEAPANEEELGATQNFSNLSDQDLRKKVLECANDLRKMDFKFSSEKEVPRRYGRSSEEFAEYAKELITQSDRQRNEFQSTLFPITRALHEELLARLATRDVKVQPDYNSDFVFEHGSLAGPNPLGAAAARLEQLSRMLG